MTQRTTRDDAWGAAARDWAEAQEGTMRPVFEKVLDLAGVGPGRAVLDVACGTGLLCLLARARGATASGIDTSPTQLAVARERLPDADLRQGEMEDLPFAAGSFDLITCCNALQYAMDTVVALKEMRRVGRPGALVGIMTPSRSGPGGMGAYFAALAPFRTAPGPAAAPKAIFRDPEALDRALAAAGLAVVADGDVDCDWDYPDLDTALRGGLSFAPGVRAIRQHGKEVIYTAITEALAPHRTPSGGYHLPNRSRYVLARVPASAED